MRLNLSQFKLRFASELGETTHENIGDSSYLVRSPVINLVE